MLTCLQVNMMFIVFVGYVLCLASVNVDMPPSEYDVYSLGQVGVLFGLCKVDMPPSEYDVYSLGQICALFGKCQC